MIGPSLTIPMLEDSNQPRGKGYLFYEVSNLRIDNSSLESHVKKGFWRVLIDVCILSPYIGR